MNESAEDECKRDLGLKHPCNGDVGRPIFLCNASSTICVPIDYP